VRDKDKEINKIHNPNDKGEIIKTIGITILIVIIDKIFNNIYKRDRSRLKLQRFMCSTPYYKDPHQ